MKHAITGILSMGLAITAGAQELTPQQAGQYMSAAGEILSTQKMMQGIAKVCGESAAQLSVVWYDRNKAAVAKAEKLRGTVLQEIQRSKGSEPARTFEEKQDKFLAEKVAGVVREIEALPPEKKKHICGRYAQTVSQGDWDISKNKGLYNFLMSAK